MFWVGFGSNGFAVRNLSFPPTQSTLKGLNNMKLYTADDTATLWGISVQMVRRYCRENKVPGAVQTEQGWMIPEGTPKPGAQMVRETPPTPLVKKILYQHERNNHFGIYEYIQVNLAYSSSRMASNRLTRNQVEEMYRTKRLTASFEPTKVDDIVEMMNHFICMRYVIDNVTAPLTVSFIKQYCLLVFQNSHTRKCLRIKLVQTLPVIVVLLQDTHKETPTAFFRFYPK